MEIRMEIDYHAQRRQDRERHAQRHAIDRHAKRLEEIDSHDQYRPEAEGDCHAHC